MVDRSVVIIGAGLAGLATGCYAQMNGYKARIYERHTQPGGVAATWKRKGYTIDGGVYFFIGHHPGQSIYEVYRELGIIPSTEFQTIETYARYVDMANGRVLDVTRNMDRLAMDMKDISAEDSGFTDWLIAGVKAMRGVEMGADMTNPIELFGFWDQLKMIWSMRRVGKYMSGRYNASVRDASRGVRDPWLRELIERLFLPEVPVWFVLMILALLADGQLSLCIDGSAGFVRAIEERFKDLGGEIIYEAKVEEILVQRDRAIGVRLAGGEEHRADVVVSAADGHLTIFELLGGRYLDEDIRQRYSRWPLCRPTVMMSFGVAGEISDQPWLLMVSQAEKLRAGMVDDHWLAVRVFNYSPIFAPPGKTLIQVMIETDWHAWRQLREDMAAYRVEKEKVAAEVLSRLAELWPGIAEQVDMIDVATPYTTWRYTSTYQGAYMGWLPTPEILRTKMAKTLPGLGNFYMAGQWAMPCGGVMPSLYSGRHVVQLICHHDAKPFRTTCA